jgi:hypothetical protein
MIAAPGTPPQRAVHIPQLFGSPNSPFQFNFFPRDHNMFLNNPQPMLRFPTARPGFPPVSRMPNVANNVMAHSPRIISCEELEKGDSHVAPANKDQTDGFPKESPNEASHFTPENVMKNDTTHSVLEGLQLLNILDEQSRSQHECSRAPVNDTTSPMESMPPMESGTTASSRNDFHFLNADLGHSSTQIAGQNQTVAYLQETNGTIGIVSRSNDNKSDDFQPPPKVQNIAVASEVRTPGQKETPFHVIKTC